MPDPRFPTRPQKAATWGGSVAPEAARRCAASGGLLTMELELSRICNLSCIYCYADSGARLPNELSLEEIKDAADQAKALGAGRIIVLGGGEPLAYPRILDVLRHLRSLDVDIELFTNGTLLTAELARELFRLAVKPVIKLNSLVPEVQDHLAGAAGTFEAIMRGLDHLLAAGYPAEDRPMGAQTIVCAQNIDELPDMWIWLRERGIIPYFEMITLQGRAGEHAELQVEPARIGRLFQRLADLDRERYGIKWTPHPAVAAFTCDRHLYSCTVAADGDVLPCPGVNIPVGNIREKPLADILAQSQVIRELRDIRRTIKGACKTCDLADTCYGCRGMAYQATGDHLAADPTCWRNAEAGRPAEPPRTAGDLIPHEPPMRVIEVLDRYEGDAGEALATVRPDWAGVDEDGRLDPAVFMELIAQAYACLMGYEIRLRGLEMAEGYLVGIKRFKVLGQAGAGDELRVAVSTKGRLEGFAVVAGEVRRAGEVLAVGEIKVWSPEAAGEGS